MTPKEQLVKVLPHDFGAVQAGLNMDRLNQFVDELAVEDYLRKAVKDDSSKHNLDCSSQRDD